MNLIIFARLVVPVFLGYLFVKFLLKWAISIHVLALLLDFVLSQENGEQPFRKAMLDLDQTVLKIFVHYFGSEGIVLLSLGIFIGVLVILLNIFRNNNGGVFFIRSLRRRYSVTD